MFQSPPTRITPMATIRNLQPMAQLIEEKNSAEWLHTHLVSQTKVADLGIFSGVQQDVHRLPQQGMGIRKGILGSQANPAES